MKTFVIVEPSKLLDTTWRQTWERIINGEHTHELVHTYHLSENDACDYVYAYVREMNSKPTGTYFMPVGTAKVHRNDSKMYAKVFESKEKVYWDINTEEK